MLAKPKVSKVGMMMKGRQGRHTAWNIEASETGLDTTYITDKEE